MYVSAYVYFHKAETYIYTIYMYVFSGILRCCVDFRFLHWFPVQRHLYTAICKHDLGNIRLGNSVIFTTKG